mmetsp:Transcript_22014/g.54409  ORF Transcript_22014/g.54409 Transcript_22014/m.54409 type:complete len:317 (+) Transcript_22014:296-1246(+)
MKIPNALDEYALRDESFERPITILQKLASRIPNSVPSIDWWFLASQSAKLTKHEMRQAGLTNQASTYLLYTSRCICNEPRTSAASELPEPITEFLFLIDWAVPQGGREGEKKRIQVHELLLSLNLCGQGEVRVLQDAPLSFHHPQWQGRAADEFPNAVGPSRTMQYHRNFRALAQFQTPRARSRAISEDDGFYARPLSPTTAASFAFPTRSILFCVDELRPSPSPPASAFRPSRFLSTFARISSRFAQFLPPRFRCSATHHGSDPSTHHIFRSLNPRVLSRAFPSNNSTAPSSASARSWKCSIPKQWRGPLVEASL